MKVLPQTISPDRWLTHSFSASNAAKGGHVGKWPMSNVSPGANAFCKK